MSGLPGIYGSFLSSFQCQDDLRFSPLITLLVVFRNGLLTPLEPRFPFSPILSSANFA